MYIVVGANGFLGSNMLNSLHSNSRKGIIAACRGSSEENHFPYALWIKCDVTNKDDVSALRQTVADISKCKIFYFAACHNLDVVKRDPAAARKINVDSLHFFLEEFKDAKCLYFSSTDCVYGENSKSHPLFSESDSLSPVNEYGHQKAEAEELVRRYGFNVVRLPFMLGASKLEHKKHFYDNIIEKAKNGEKITLADGLWRSALDYESVSDILVKLSDMDNVPQTLNLCGDDSLTKYDVGEMIEKKYHLPHENIVKVPESEIQKLFFETRASSAAMDNSLLKQVIGVESIKLKI